MVSKSDSLGTGVINFHCPLVQQCSIVLLWGKQEEIKEAESRAWERHWKERCGQPRGGSEPVLGAGGPPTPACFMTLGCLCHGALGTSVLRNLFWKTSFLGQSCWRESYCLTGTERARADGAWRCGCMEAVWLVCRRGHVFLPSDVPPLVHNC